VATPWNNFVICEGDEPSVSVELVHAALTITDPRDIDLYRDLYARLRERAAVLARGWRDISMVGENLARHVVRNCCAAPRDSGRVTAQVAPAAGRVARGRGRFAV
jgi:hypothetical protein